VKTVYAVVLGLVVWGMSGEAMAARFNGPKWNGYALDWCKNFEGACGKPAADLYCQKKGYPQSTGFVKLDRVSYQTMTIGQNAICDPRNHQCDSFASIDCQETVKTFFTPTYNGYRLDWCRVFEGQCGAAAATQYCQKAGYAYLVSFHIQPHVSTPTMTVGSNAICDPRFHGCDSFSYVQCKN
jgi:hypothetical protein